MKLCMTSCTFFLHLIIKYSMASFPFEELIPYLTVLGSPAGCKKGFCMYDVCGTCMYYMGSPSHTYVFNANSLFPPPTLYNFKGRLYICSKYIKWRVPFCQKILFLTP